MGIYGLQTWGEYYARWLQTELREANYRLDRIRGRMSHTQDLLRDQGLSHSLGEDLACPACQARYKFGELCPACDVELVCESFVDSVEPFGRKVDSPGVVVARSLAFAGTAFGVVMLLTGLFLFMDLHPDIMPRDGDVLRTGIGVKSKSKAVARGLAVHQRIAYVDHGTALTHRLRVEVVADQPGRGPALHLVGPGGDLDGAGDCHASNCTTSSKPLDWGIAGLFTDDPELWGDASTESSHGARILAPTPGTYSVMLVAPGQGAAGASPARVKVYVDGNLAYDEARVPGAGADAQQACQIIFPSGDVRML